MPKKKKGVDRLVAAADSEFATTIPVGPEKYKLEARLANPKSGDVAIIFCPALPPAGNMYIPEVGVLQARLAKDGYVTVRFNYRGVGSSEGDTYFRSAHREMEDVREIAKWLAAHRAHFKLPRLRACWLVGVSYGSVIASAAAHYDEFDGYVAVAYPYSYLWYCTGFDSKTFYDLAAQSKKPKLFVWGETDVFAGKGAMDKCWQGVREPKSNLVLPQLDSMLGHYFRSKGNLDALYSAITAFLADIPDRKGLPIS